MYPDGAARQVQVKERSRKRAQPCSPSRPETSPIACAKPCVETEVTPLMWLAVASRPWPKRSAMIAGPSGNHLQYSPSGPPRKLAFGSNKRGSVGPLCGPQTLMPACFEAATDAPRLGQGLLAKLRICVRQTVVSKQVKPNSSRLGCRIYPVVLQLSIFHFVPRCRPFRCRRCG